MHYKLRAAIAATNPARDDYRANCLIVWHELLAIDSDLAEEILSLGFDESTAAEWFCRANSNGDTPAERVALGRHADVRAAIQRTAHGIAG